MSKQALTDAGVGRALFTTRLRLSLQAGWMCVTFGALPGFVLAFAFWFWCASPFHVDVLRFAVVSRLLDDGNPHRWYFRADRASRATLTFVSPDGEHRDRMTASQARAILAAPYRLTMMSLQLATVGAVFSAVLGFLLVLTLLRRFGAGSQQNQRVRGAQLVVSAKELSRQVRKKGGATYTLAEVALPKPAPMAGILVEGAQRSGKSVVIHDLMRQVFRRQRKCVIFDQSSEYYRAYYRPGRDFIFNPSLDGSVPWSIFAELRKTYDADTMAQAFLPQRSGAASGPNAFFEDAARAVFSSVLLRLAEAGAVNTRDIAKVLLEMPADQMNFLIKNTVASSAIGGDSKTQRQGVISSIAIYLSGLAAVAPGRWSVREFLESPGDARLFIVGTDDTKAMFSALYRLLLTTAFSAIAGRQEIVHEDRYWFFLDEVHELGDFALDRQLATLGKYGVCTVAGIQAESQFISAVGRERADTIANCFNTTLFLRSNEPGAQERIAKRLGKVEMDTVTRNQALAVAEWRDGAGLNKSEHEKWLVMPAEIGSLETCTGWLKLVGGFPAAKVDYRHWLRPGREGRIGQFAPVHAMPPEAPSFRICVAECKDALATLDTQWQEEQKRLQANKAQAAAPANDGSPNTSSGKPAESPPVSTASGETAPAAPAASAQRKSGSSPGATIFPLNRASGKEAHAAQTELFEAAVPLHREAPSAAQDLMGDQQQLQGDAPQPDAERSALDGPDMEMGR